MKALQDIFPHLHAAVLSLLLLASAGEAREVQITLLHTTDVHGHIFPGTDYDGNANVGGMLRCATLIEKIRNENPNALLVDCGDSIQGAAESYLTGGQLTRRAFEWLKYDAWVLGNHEFDWGIRALEKVHNATSLTMLGANIGVRQGRRNPLARVKPYTMRTVDGVRIALVGLTTPGIPSWTLPDYLGDVRFEGSVSALNRIMPEVRDQEPDIMVLLLHQGYRPFGDDFANEVKAIASRFSEFDAIIGGHTHVVQRSVDVHGVLYSQAGYHANWLGRLDLVYDTVERKVTRKEADVLLVGDDYPLHTGLAEALKEDLDVARAYLDTKVGETSTDLEASLNLPGQSAVQQLLCMAIAERSGADVVLHGVLDDQRVVRGDVTRADVWRMVPYENRIGLAQLTVGEIKDILEENARYAGGFSFMGVYGICYDLVEQGDGYRVAHIRLPDGSLPHPRKRMSVAFNSYVLASGGQRFPVLKRTVDRPESRLKITSQDTRTAVEAYVRKHSPLAIEDGREVTVVRGGL